MLLVGSYVKLTKKPYESFPISESALGKVIKIDVLKQEVTVSIDGVNKVVGYSDK